MHGGRASDSGVRVSGECRACGLERVFESPDDFYSCRSSFKSTECPYGKCVPRERAISLVATELFGRDRMRTMDIHEVAPTGRGFTLWLRQESPGYVSSGYFPETPFGQMVGFLRNEDIEAQTFESGVFDLVLHLDVMEHIFRPFEALREVWRTLRPGGFCLFTTPTYPDRSRSEQVAFREGEQIRVVGEPEYHGNPQHPDEGALVTWRYGYDLPMLIARETEFDVEVRRWQSRRLAIMGPMTEVYILHKGT